LVFLMTIFVMGTNMGTLFRLVPGFPRCWGHKPKPGTPPGMSAVV
jgi:hypothetical protein